MRGRAADPDVGDSDVFEQNMNHFIDRLVPVAALCLPLLAPAQPRVDPADAQAPASPLRYQSAFAGYKPWQEVKPGNWRQLNDDLATPSGAPSGHTGHSGHGAAARPAATPPPGPSAAPAPAAPRLPGSRP